MKKFHLLITLLLSISIHFAASAQNNDYIITVKGDTVKSFFSSSIFSGTPKYRTDTLDDYKKLDPASVKAYHQEDDKFVRYAVLKYDSQKLEYLECLESGKISLYKGYEGSARYPYEVWYIQKNGQERVIPIKTKNLLASEKKAKQYFTILIADTPLVQQQFLNLEDFSFKTIQHIIRLYNSENAKNQSRLK